MDRRQNIIYNLVKLVGPGPWPQIVSPLPALDVRASDAGTNSMCNLMLGLPSPRKNQSRRCVFLSGGHAEDFKKITVGRKVLANTKSRNEHAGDLDVITPGWDAPYKVAVCNNNSSRGKLTSNPESTTFPPPGPANTCYALPPAPHLPDRPPEAGLGGLYCSLLDIRARGRF